MAKKNKYKALKYYKLFLSAGPEWCDKGDLIEADICSLHNEIGEECERNQSGDKALRNYEAASAHGRYAYNLGRVYEFGLFGKEIDYARAADLYYSNLGDVLIHSSAVLGLGRFHEKGLGGLAVDPKKAFELYNQYCYAVCFSNCPKEELIPRWIILLNSPDRELIKIVSDFILDKLHASFDTNLHEVATTRREQLAYSPDNLNNPWFVYDTLLQKRQEPVDLQLVSTFLSVVIKDRRVRLDPDGLYSLGRSPVDPLSVPNITEAHILDIFANINAKRDTPANKANIDEIIQSFGRMNGAKQKTFPDFAQFVMSSPSILPVLRKNSLLSAQLKCVLSVAFGVAFNEETLLPTDSTLTSVEFNLIKILSSYYDCDVGQDENTSIQYKLLPDEFKTIKMIRPQSAEKTSTVQEAETYVIDILKDIILRTLTTANPFLNKVCGAERVGGFLPHQGRYMTGFIGDSVGLDVHPEFDYYVHLLSPSLKKLDERKKSYVLQKFFDFMWNVSDDTSAGLPHIVSEVKRRIDILASSSNAFIRLAPITRAEHWRLDPDTGIAEITADGVAELLLRIGILTDLTPPKQTETLSYTPSPSEFYDDRGNLLDLPQITSMQTPPRFF